jgi:hypothetical protein
VTPGKNILEMLRNFEASLDLLDFNPGFKLAFKKVKHMDTAAIISIEKDIFVHFRGFCRVCADGTAMKITFGRSNRV